MMVKIIKDKIRQRFVSQYSDLLSKDMAKAQDLERTVTSILEDIISREHVHLSEEDKKTIIDEIIDEFIGFGPISGLMKDPHITEIMINGSHKIYVEKEGKTQLTNITFDNEQQLMRLVYKILSPTRRHVDEMSPYTDVSLKDNSRVNIIIPPLAVDGPVVTIRKFLKKINTVEDLIGLGTLDRRMADFLVASMKAKANIVFSGSTGVGKTTTLKVLSSYIYNDERIVTIEDTPELCLAQEHVVRLQTKQPNIEGKGEITIRELFRNSLRMRPDRIILGEIRGAEALDMLQAICSGHTGSLSVIHANSPKDVIYRIEAMVITSGVPISLEAIHRHIAAAINIIIHEEQLLDGSRKITHITQVKGLKDNQVVLEDIFLYDLEDVDSQGKIKGKWKATGVIPVFYPLFKKAGLSLPKNIFTSD